MLSRSLHGYEERARPSRHDMTALDQGGSPGLNEQVDKAPAATVHECHLPIVQN